MQACRKYYADLYVAETVDANEMKQFLDLVDPLLKKVPMIKLQSTNVYIAAINSTEKW